MKKKYLVLILVGLILVGGSCSEEKVGKELATDEIIREDAFIRDEARLNIDEDEEEERIVLYVLNKEIKEDTSLWCGNLSGEKMNGVFYLALIDNNKVISRIELLMESLENGGEYREKQMILPQDLNGDGKDLEFTFNTYASCNGNYVEIIGWSFKEEKLIRYQFHKEDEIFEELFISNGLEYKEDSLIQEYYSNAEPSGTFHNYYSFSEEKEAYDFLETVKISD